jgi:homogentisate 1,2-dioxygenase
VDADRIEATAAWFRSAGATVEVIGNAGDRHDISPRQRLRAREIIRGARATPGASGFGNTIQSEAVPGALPTRQNSPRLPPFGLYAEQLNGSGFTAQRADNVRTWCYRIRPTSQRRDFAPLDHPLFAASFEGRAPAINLTGFAPLSAPAEPRDFLDGLVTVAGAGSPTIRRGCAVHLYSCNRDMDRRAFYDADGDLLLLPELGAITLMTELGPLEVAPGQIAIVPRGVTFSVLLHGGMARGYVGETFGRHFRLPERGPAGANGLSDPRHFHAPAAWYEDRLVADFRIVAKLGGHLHQASQDHSPFDVVAWHGNYLPYVYDLLDFSPIGSVRFDHPDPSLYTVLSAPLDEPGAHTLDLVVFVPRWDVTRNLRPLLSSQSRQRGERYRARIVTAGEPFQPGCCFITPSLTGRSERQNRRAHRALDESKADARFPGNSLWFQFEALPLSSSCRGSASRLGGHVGQPPSYFDPLSP